MRQLFSLMFVSTISAGLVGCTPSTDVSDAPAPSVSQVSMNETVEAGCASCIFEMEGTEGCQLAVKIDGKPYLVSGADVDAHESGLCESAKQAVVTGTVEAGKFVATSFELQP